jgi:hypothetical protein
MVKPLRLGLLAGKKWAGELIVRGQCPYGSGGFVVDFDAIDERSTYERHVMDRAILSALQIEEWTGHKMIKVK